MFRPFGYVLFVGVALAAITAPALAAGAWTSSAVPEKVEIVRADGFVIFGAFGNPGATPCDVADALWVSVSHAQYEALLSTALAALAGGLKLRAFPHSCTVYGWHGGSHNEIISGGALEISK